MTPASANGKCGCRHAPCMSPSGKNCPTCYSITCLNQPVANHVVGAPAPTSARGGTGMLQMQMMVDPRFSARIVNAANAANAQNNSRLGVGIGMGVPAPAPRLTSGSAAVTGSQNNQGNVANGSGNSPNEDANTASSNSVGHNVVGNPFVQQQRRFAGAASHGSGTGSKPTGRNHRPASANRSTSNSTGGNSANAPTAASLFEAMLLPADGNSGANQGDGTSGDGNPFRRSASAAASLRNGGARQVTAVAGNASNTGPGGR